MARPEELRLMAKIAALYYEHNLRQSEIAERLELSQASVSRLLKRAADEGIVQISIAVPRGSYTALETALEHKYGLREAIVVESDDNGDQLLRNLGAATAFYLETTLRSGDVVGVSSWSETLLAAANALHPLSRRDQIAVVQTLGGVGNPNAEMHAIQLTRRLAQLMHAEAHLLPVPGVVSSRATRDILLQDGSVAQTTALFDRVTLALVGIGAVEPSRLLASSGNVFTPAELQALEGAGAVGDICLRFYDRDGQQVDTSLRERVIGISLDQLRRVSRTVGIAGGVRKRQAIWGAVRGGLIHVLITDHHTAQWLAEQEAPAALPALR